MNSNRDFIPNQKDWPERERANQVARLTYLGRSPAIESFLSPALTWVLTGVDSNDYNGVAWAKLPAATADQTITDVLRRFQQRRLPFLWHLDTTSQPTDLGQRLVNQGCTRLQPGIAMTLDLSDFNRPATKFLGLMVQRVSTKALLHSWLQVWQEVYQEPITERERLYSSLGLAGDQPLQHYIASRDGRHLAVAQMFFHQQTAGIYAVGVLPMVQQQGVATAMLSA